MSELYPSNLEIRRWAEAKGLPVQPTGKLPLTLIKAWNRAFPDRPYNKYEAHHGTPSGYNGRGCKCERCLAAINARERARYRNASEDREWDDAGAL